MAKALTAARSGLRRFFSISAFTPPPAPTPPPKADPSTNLFVSGLSKRTTSEGLREAFSKFGEIIQAKVVTDRVSGYSKGFGFVRYASIEDANEGIKGMDGKFLDGWVIFAEYAKPKPPPSQDQPSQPQSNYGYATPFNYSAQASHSTPYYASDTTSNFSSHASQSTQPPSSNSYQTSQPQSGYYDNSLPPSNYSSQSSQPPSNYSSQSSHPPSNYTSSYFNYSPQTMQPAPNSGPVPPFNHSPNVSLPNFNHSSQPSQPQPNNWSVPPSDHSSSPNFNHHPQTSHPLPSTRSIPPSSYSSEISAPTSNSPQTPPSWYSSQTTQPADHNPGAPNYPQSYYGSAPTSDQFSRASQQYNYSPQASNPAPGYASTAPNHSPSKFNVPAGDVPPRNPGTFDASEPQAEYDSGRAAANY